MPQNAGKRGASAHQLSNFGGGHASGGRSARGKKRRRGRK